jgi:hypothetical protein
MVIVKKTVMHSSKMKENIKIRKIIIKVSSNFKINKIIFKVKIQKIFNFQGMTLQKIEVMKTI